MLWDIMSKQRMNIFKGDSKKLPSGKTNFPFAYISTSWNFWRKALFWGMSLSQFVPFIYFPHMSLFNAPKKDRHPPSVSTTWRGAPVNFVSMTSYFNLLASQTSVFLEPQTTCRPQGPGESREKKNMETSKEDEHLKNGVFFFGVFLFWKLEAIGKKTVKPGYTGYTHSDSDECSHFLLVLFVEISDVVRHGEQNYRWESLNTSFDSKKISNNRQ